MIEVTIRQLEYAVALADAGHFGRAAEAVAVSQPGLSSQIRELERKLGVALFERTARGVHLTPAGAEVVERARRVLRDVQELELSGRAHAAEPHGLLRLGAIPTVAPYLLPTVVRAVRRRWPAITLDLHELQTVALVAAVDRGDLDLGLLAVPVETGSLHVEPLGHEDFLLALPEQHALSRAASVELTTLHDLPVLLMEEGHCLHEHVRDACALAGASDHAVVHSAGLSTLAQMVASGQGVTLLPAGAVAVEARAGNGLVVRPFTDPVPGRTIALVWRPSDPRAAQFATLAPALRDAIAELWNARGAPL